MKLQYKECTCIVYFSNETKTKISGTYPYVLQKKLRLEKQQRRAGPGKVMKSAENGTMNGEMNGINGTNAEPKVQDIENIVPDAVTEQKNLDRILDKTR